MFKLTRRTTTIALLAASALGSGVVAAPASAETTANTKTIIAVHPGENGLLLPAVQKVREAAARL